MNETNAIREQLWDLVYGLLEPDEVAALHARIKSDPAIARMYADTALEAGLIAKAARVETAPVELPSPADKALLTKQTSSPAKAGIRVPTSSFARGLQWFAGMGATALAILIAVMLWRPESAALPITATAKVLEVFGNAQWQPGISNQVTVLARAPSGEPQSVPLRLEVRDPHGQVNFFCEAQTSEAGIAELEIPGEAVKFGNRLQVQLADRETEDTWRETRLSSVSAALPAPQEAPRASVTLDRDWYQPGETIRSRAVVLGRTTLEAPADAVVWYDVTGPDGKQYESVTGKATVANGVAAAEVKLPENAPEGRYAFKVRGETSAAIVDGAEFFVRRELPLAPDDAIAMETSKAPVPSAAGAGKASKGGASTISNAKSGAGGVRGFFKPPANAPVPPNRPFIVRNKRQSDVADSKAAPAKSNATSAGVDMLAEKTADGRPASEPSLEAELGQQPGLASSSDEFGTAAAGQSSRRLRLNLPADLAGKQLKVVVADSRGEVLQTGDAIAKSGDNSLDSQPLADSLADPLAASNARGGAAAGSSPPPTDKAETERLAEPAKPRAENRMAEVEITLAPEVQGQIQTYAVDISQGTARVVAQDESFVPAARELNIHFHDYDADHIAGQAVRVELLITDEANRPAPGAVVGIRVVDEVALQAPPELETLAAHWGLPTPTRLGLADENEARSLARGGERLARRYSDAAALSKKEGLTADQPVAELAAPTGQALGLEAMYGNVGAALEREQRVLASAQSGETVLASNRDAVEAALQQSLNARASQRSVDYRFAGQVLVFGALALACAALLAYGLRLATNAKVWIPTIGVCAASLVVGLVWMERTSSRPATVAKGVRPLDELSDFTSTTESLSEFAAPSEQPVTRDDSETAGARDQTGNEEQPQLRKALENSREQAEDRFGYEKRPLPAADAPSQPSRFRQAPSKSGDSGASTEGAPMPDGERSGGAKRDAKELPELKRQRAESPEPTTADAPSRAARAQGSSRMKSTPEAASGAKASRFDAGNAASAPSSTPSPPAASPASPTPPLAKDAEEKKSGQDAQKFAAPAAKPSEPRPFAAKQFADLAPSDARPPAPGMPEVKSSLMAVDPQVATSYVPLWEPRLIADENGRVQVNFTLPPRAAYYHVIVDAHGDGRIGSATTALLAAPLVSDDAKPKNETDKAPAADKAPPEKPQSEKAPPDKTDPSE